MQVEYTFDISNFCTSLIIPMVAFIMSYYEKNKERARERAKRIREEDTDEDPKFSECKCGAQKRLKRPYCDKCRKEYNSKYFKRPEAKEAGNKRAKARYWEKKDEILEKAKKKRREEGRREKRQKKLDESRHVCPRCGGFRPKAGAYCDKCRVEYQKEWYEKNKERVNKASISSQKRRKDKDPEAFHEKRRKERLKRRSYDVYKFYHGPTGKFYIGCSMYANKRWAVHKRQMREGAHDNQNINELIKKYGFVEENWDFVILYSVNSEEEMKEFETKLLEKSKDNKLCLNIKTGKRKDSKKQKPFILYKMIHLPTGRFYIGFTSNLAERRQEHRFRMRRLTHKNPNVIDIIRREGFIFDNWIFEEIGSFLVRQDAVEAERRMIIENKGNEKLLNIK